MLTDFFFLGGEARTIGSPCNINIYCRYINNTNMFFVLFFPGNNAGMHIYIYIHIDIFHHRTIPIKSYNGLLFVISSPRGEGLKQWDKNWGAEKGPGEEVARYDRFCLTRFFKTFCVVL